MTAARGRSTSLRKQRRAAQRRQSLLLSLGLMALGVLLIAGFFTISYNSANPGNIRPIKVGEPISDFFLVDLQGNPVKLSDYTGQAVLINAWATWCPPCRAEMPLLQSYYDAHRAEGFTLLAINAGESQPTVSNFIQQSGFTFPVLLDSNNAILNRLGIRSFPTSFLVGTDGIVKAIYVGMLSPESVEAEITAQLNEK